jgi:hypothetical protein
MTITSITSANVTSQPAKNTQSPQRPSVPSTKTTTKKEAHLGITISWAGAPWPAPGTRPALLIFKSDKSILIGGAGC